MRVSLSNLNPINSHGLNVKSQKSSKNVTKTNVASSYNSSKVNQAILNNLSFTSGVVSKEIVEMAQKKYKEFCDVGKKAWELCEKHQFDMPFQDAAERMGSANNEIVMNGYKYTRDTSKTCPVYTRVPIAPDSDVKSDVFDSNNYSRTIFYKNGKKDIIVRLSCSSGSGMPVGYRYVLGYKEGVCDTYFDCQPDVNYAALNVYPRAKINENVLHELSDYHFSFNPDNEYASMWFDEQGNVTGLNLHLYTESTCAKSTPDYLFSFADGKLVRSCKSSLV